MAKKRSSRRSKKLTLKPAVKHFDSTLKALKRHKKKKGTTPQQRKQLDRHIGLVTRLRMMTTDGCGDFFLPV